MLKRIRYVKSGDGGLISKQVLKSVSGDELIATIGPTGRSGTIKSVINNEIKAEVTGTSPHKTKIALKKALYLLGVNFEKEKRDASE